MTLFRVALMAVSLLGLVAFIAASPGPVALAAPPAATRSGDDENGTQVARIRARYNAVQVRVAATKPGPDGAPATTGYLCDELRLNVTDHVYPAVGNLREQRRYFYEVPSGESPLSLKCLVFLTIHKEEASAIEDEEYLLSDTGSLLFYFNRRGNSGERTATEIRIYYRDGAVLRFARGGAAKTVLSADDKQAATRTLSSAKALGRAFALAH